MKLYDYFIGTGWWCSEAEPAAARRYVGSDLIRTAAFHHLWSAAIDGWSRPKAVLIVDSASEVKPPITNPSYQILKLIRNPGHAVHHTGQYSGWMASVLHSIEYALTNDIDYFVYVEQDALVFGHEVIEYCISKMRKPLMFGSAGETPQPIQQSLFIIRNDGMRSFLSGLHAIGKKDKDISPEWKFVLAALSLHGRFAERLLSHESFRQLIFKFIGGFIQSVGYELLPIGFGRCRPIRFTDEQYYFQHGTIAEVREYMMRLPQHILSSAIRHSSELANLLR